MRRDYVRQFHVITLKGMKRSLLDIFLLSPWPFCRCDGDGGASVYLVMETRG